MRNYAQLLISLGRAIEAEPLARQAVAKATASASLGHTHPVTEQSAATHANALDALGRHPEAVAVRKQFGLPEPTTQRTTSQTPQPTTNPG